MSRRDEGCVSDLTLDRVLTHEAGAEQRADVHRHVASCPRCQARLASFEAAQREFAVNAPPLTAAQSVRRLRAWWLSGASLAVAAGVVFALVRAPAPQDAVRTKGGELLGFFVKRGEHVFQGDDGASLAPGDELRFQYSSAHAAWLAVFGIDAHNHVSVYFPTHGARTAAIDAGMQRLLPEAVALDDTLGPEQLVGVFCERERALSELTAELQTTAAVSGCHITRLRVTKQVR